MLANAYGTPYYTMRRGGAAMGRLRGLRGLRGLGSTCDPNSGVCYDDNGNVVGVLPQSSLPGDVQDALGVGSGSMNSPASGSTMASIASAITQDFTSIFKVIQPIPPGCTQIQTSAGTSVSCAGPGSSAPALSLSSMSSLSGLLMPLLVIGGVLLLVKK